jgi:conjugative relaxase-like TrwC/TraI family protein
VLSTAKVRTGSWRYYANQVGHGACEYFLGVGEAPGRWQGRGIERLGLEVGGEVREWQLEATFGRAIQPVSNVGLGRSWRVDGVTGYDLCFSAPKSVSALWALGGPDIAAAITAAHAAAVTAGLDYLDDHAAYSRVGRDGHRQVGTGGFAAAVFDHRTSRAGDPQLHTHALVVNKLQCPDGEWRTIDGHEIYAHKKSAGVLYQAGLRSELTRRLGVGWDPVSRDGQAEIAGVPTGLITRWSTRTAQILADAAPVIAGYEAALGRPLTCAERTAVTKVAVIKTRPEKEPVDIVGLVQRWHDEAAALGWTPDRLRAAVRPPPQLHVASGVQRLVIDAVTAAGSRKAVFTRSDLVAQVAARIPTDAAVAAATIRAWVEQLTDQALQTPEAVELRPERDGPARASDARYASATTLAQELEIVGFAERGRRAGVALCHPAVVLDACRAAGLDYAQAQAVNRITRSGDQVSVLVAPAGTGKTTTLAAAVAAWHTSGVPVIALAPSARAAKELAAATGPADTVAKYRHQHQQWPVDPRYQLGSGGVLIVDEASMLPTVDLHALTHDVDAAGGKLLLVGDPAQIGAVDAAGGMLAPLADRLAAPSLIHVHRMRHAWERAASLQLRAGNADTVAAYVDHDRIHPVGADTDPYDMVLADYQRLSAEGGRVLLLARTHDDVDALNHRARQHAITTGQVCGAPLITTGDRDWRVGDRLRASRNDRRIPVGTPGDHLRNGDTFTVAQHATYGWASTIDAAQGATVDHSLTLARPGLDRTRLYVAMTRGRDTNQLYLAPEPDPEITARNKSRRISDPTEQVRQMLATADENSAAHTRLPDPAAISTRARADITQPPAISGRDLQPPERDDERHRHFAPDRSRGYGLSR